MHLGIRCYNALCGLPLYTHALFSAACNYNNLWVLQAYATAGVTRYWVCYITCYKYIYTALLMQNSQEI